MKSVPVRGVPLKRRTVHNLLMLCILFFLNGIVIPLVSRFVPLMQYFANQSARSEQMAQSVPVAFRAVSVVIYIYCVLMGVLIALFDYGDRLTPWMLCGGLTLLLLLQILIQLVPFGGMALVDAAFLTVAFCLMAKAKIRVRVSRKAEPAEPAEL